MAATVTVRYRNGDVIADISSICMDKQLSFRLNRPASFTFRVPSYLVNELQDDVPDPLPLLCTGRRQISVTTDAMGLCFHGLVWNIEDDGDEDMVYSRVTCWDPMIVWRYRPARDLVDSYSGDAGNLSDPSFIARNKFGGPIMEEILYASENPVLIPGEAEGQLFIDLDASTFTAGGADLSGAPTNWPMTIAEIATLLTNTGELDIVLTPVIGTVGADNFMNMATLATYTGNYGTDRTATVHFDYATGDNNARLFRRHENMDTIGNKIFYYLGPRMDQQHWRSNVTRDHPDFSTIPSFPQLDTDIDVSRAFYGVYMLNNIYDNFGSGHGSVSAGETSAYWLFMRQWMVESLLRLGPRNLVYITPVRDTAALPAGGDVFTPGDFGLGDLITINIGAKTRKAESGAQRVYAFTVDIDDDGVEALGEFVTSPDQDTI